MKAMRPSEDADAQHPLPPRGRRPGRRGRTGQSIVSPPKRKPSGIADNPGEQLARAIDDTAALLMDLSELIRDLEPSGHLGSGTRHALAMKLGQLTRRSDLLAVTSTLRKHIARAIIQK